MIGIIYKFSIIAKYKINGHRPFYVGQHCRLDNFKDYFGSGTIWNNYLKRLKKDYPNHWRKFIKREILFQRECSQKVLDVMEMYYIKKYKAHYSLGLGGCNILLGTSNGFGAGSPSKDPLVRKKISKSRKGKCSGKDHPMYGKHPSAESIRRSREGNIGKQAGEKHWHYGQHWSDEVKKRIGDANRGKRPWLGKHHSEETKRKLSMYFSGKRPSEETRKKMRENNGGKNNPMYGRIRINNGIVNKTIKLGEEIPDGFVLGMKTWKWKKNETNRSSQKQRNE